MTLNFARPAPVACVGTIHEVELNGTKITAAAAGVAILAGTGWFYSRADGSEGPAFRTAAIERGNVRSTVSATGTLGAVQTIQVGTQVSGQVAAIYVDYNDRVRRGQLLARIDPRLQDQAVEDARAQLERAEATMAQADSDHARGRKLFDANAITASELSTLESNLAVEKAGVKSARIALDRARQNLAYTDIHAPIAGVIVERNVDVGQTVAASFAAPQLFLIANDLADMRILVSVDESDIGAIRPGQPVQFTVQAYPGDVFTGSVQQVRLQSKTQDNVVSYTAVVAVKNRTGKLLPGMTATVHFLTGHAENVLVVPNAALRVRPTPAMLARATPDERPGSAIVWTLDDRGNPAPVRVHTGLSDGRNTEIEGANLREGTKVVIGVMESGDAASEPSSSKNPFQAPRGGGSDRGG
ncbi:MAG: efflux RND transporter periplasmic adaptor subunit [Gemmatimonadaceae bacterium]|nr:efflux RND transporter periplasmic adaptor subunit [Gemmatimonadaceae bacterium]NUQ94082.1 efflux RND transporter periplasmic adaptor subunit [Gemmatimonadaceae bacterium]NUR21111.1 efflux RND transporter periplasmic adaptor subunit [Gemmatimonadaceae bacterium]NUS96395.1 efflux RND transporter periplasmic adaptor subunit [Gemmatimonadaceae bacterium]